MSKSADIVVKKFFVMPDGSVRPWESFSKEELQEIKDKLFDKVCEETDLIDIIKKMIIEGA